MTEQEVGHHLQISEMRTRFVSQSGKDSLILAVQSLSVQITRQGLNQLIEHLVPKVQVEIVFGGSSADSGIDLTAQATQWGLRARVRAVVRIDPGAPGAVRLDMTTGSSWSPLDHAMLAVIRKQLRDISQKHPEITSISPRSFRVDLQPLIYQQLTESGAPVQWDARLARVTASSGAINVTFSPLTGSG